MMPHENFITENHHLPFALISFHIQFSFCVLFYDYLPMDTATLSLSVSIICTYKNCNFASIIYLFHVHKQRTETSGGKKITRLE